MYYSLKIIIVLNTYIDYSVCHMTLPTHISHDILPTHISHDILTNTHIT